MTTPGRPGGPTGPCGSGDSEKQTVAKAKAVKQRCRDGVMNDFLFWCMHLLVPFLFHEVTSLHPPSFHRNDFSTCSKVTSLVCVIVMLTHIISHTNAATLAHR